jgi:hypothetical protein
VICRSVDGIHQYSAIRRTRDGELSLYEVEQDTLRRAGSSNAAVLTLDDLDGEVVVFVNGPVEYFNHAFFEELGECAARQDCGIAGPLVLDPDGNIISAGATGTSDGGTRDLFRGLPFSTTAHMGLARVTRSVASISSHCFAVSKSRLAAARGQASIREDGLTELLEWLVKAAHADGVKVLYTPYAVVTEAPSDGAPAIGFCPSASQLALNLETTMPLEKRANTGGSTSLPVEDCNAVAVAQALLTGAGRNG